MTAFGTIEEAVQAMKQGAADFLTKPVDTDHLMLLVDRALERRRLTEYILLKDEYQRRFGLPKVLGEDPALKESMLAIQRAAATDATVLILGESGTGKELMARAAPARQARQGPVRGDQLRRDPGSAARERAVRPREGRVHRRVGPQAGRAELAHQGTLFLDEVGDLPLALQGKILRLVQERQFERVGGVQTSASTCAWWRRPTATCEAAVARQEFREDLYFRLSVFPVEIPPLRRRRSDVLLLADAFLAPLRAPSWAARPAAPEDARRALLAHDWPGNVRELQNGIERAAILCDGARSPRATCTWTAATMPSPALAEVLDLAGPLKDVLERAAARIEEEAIRLALKETGGDRDAAAARLGISVSTLGRRLRALPPES